MPTVCIRTKVQVLFSIQHPHTNPTMIPQVSRIVATRVAARRAASQALQKRSMGGSAPAPEWTGIDKVVRGYFPEDYQREFGFPPIVGSGLIGTTDGFRGTVSPENGVLGGAQRGIGRQGSLRSRMRCSAPPPAQMLRRLYEAAAGPSKVEIPEGRFRPSRVPCKIIRFRVRPRVVFLPRFDLDFHAASSHTSIG